MSFLHVRKLLLAAFVILSAIKSNTQSVTDSLKNLLNNTTADTTRVKLMYKISDQYFNSTIHDTAMIYARQAYRLAQDIDYEKGQARSITRMGNILEATGDFSEALKAHLSALEISERIKNDKVGIGAAYNNIARVYTEQKTGPDFKNAIDYYMKAKAIFDSLGDISNLNTILINIGDNYEKMGQLDSAWQYQRQAYDMAVQNDDVNDMGISLVNLGYVQFKKGDLNGAFKSIREGTHYLIESGDKESLPDAWNSLSECFRQVGQIDSAIYYVKKSVALAEGSSNLQALLDAARQLANLYRSQEKFDSAYAYGELATRVNNNIYNNEKAGEIQRLNMREQARQVELEDKRIAEARNRKVNLQVISISVFIITFFVILVILSQKRINPRAIEILGVLGLLLVFEFITIFIHPVIGDLTHHEPVYMLIILVGIAAVLGPLHHYLTKWLKEKLVHGQAKKKHHATAPGHEKVAAETTVSQPDSNDNSSSHHSEKHQHPEKAKSNLHHHKNETQLLQETNEIEPQS